MKYIVLGVINAEENQNMEKPGRMIVVLSFLDRIFDQRTEGDIGASCVYTWDNRKASGQAIARVFEEHQERVQERREAEEEGSKFVRLQMSVINAVFAVLQSH